MSSVTIDAGALAVPLHKVSAEVARKYVRAVLGWSRLIDCPWIEVNMSENSSQALVCDKHFPFYPQLKDLITHTGIEDFDANTVNTVVLKLLDQSMPSFEKYFGVSDVLYEDLYASPDVLSPSLGNTLRSNLSRCLLLTAILRKYGGESTRSHAFVLSHAPSLVVDLRAVIYEIEHDRNYLESFPVQPEVFEGEALICDDFRGLIQCLDERSILAGSKDEFSLEAAIRIALFKSRLERGGQPEWDTLPSFRIGRHFLDTAVVACKTDSTLTDKVLKAIVEALDGLNKRKAHRIRTGPGGSDPPRMRGSDHAMRRDIDREYHLHYWSCENDFVELAVVSYPHDNYEIPD